MKYVVCVAELDMNRNGEQFENDFIVPEVCGGYTDSEFDNLDAAKSRVQEIRDEDECVDAVVIDRETKRWVTSFINYYVH